MNRGRVKAVLAMIAAIVVAAVIVIAVSATDNGSAGTTTSTVPASSTDTTAAPQSPAVGNEDNQSPLVLKTARNWTELKATIDGRAEIWYQLYPNWLNQRLSLDWAFVGKLVDYEKSGVDFRWILASNTSDSDDVVRQKLVDKGFDKADVAKWHIVRVDSFENTRLNSGKNGFVVFTDNKSQVRVVLGIPKDINDLSKDIDYSRGVLAMCGNPIRIVPPTTSTTVPTTPTTKCPPTTTSTTEPPTTTTTSTTEPPTTTTKGPTHQPGTTNVEPDGDGDVSPDTTSPNKEESTSTTKAPTTTTRATNPPEVTSTSVNNGTVPGP